MEFLCRTCLKSSQNLLDLFCEDLPHQIEVISSIQILTDDGLPTKICEDCARNVHFLYGFRKTIVESDAMLKESYVLESEEIKPKEEQPSEYDIVIDEIVIDEVKLEPFESNDSDVTDPFIMLPNVEKDCPEKITEQQKITSKKKHKGYSCKKCDFTTTSYELQRKHRLVHRNRKVLKVICNVCGVYVRSDHLGKHMSNLHTPSPASCHICEKLFKSKESLKWHMSTHRKLSLQCTECGKVYTTKNSYRNHMKRHSDTKPEECSICKKQFYTKCDLKTHFRSHTGERPYPCRYCNKGFSSGNALRTHIRRHTNEKPFKCEYCDAAFPQRVSLRTHIKSKHPDKMIVGEIKKE